VPTLTARGLGALFAQGSARAFRQMSNSAFFFACGYRSFGVLADCGTLFCGYHSADRMTFICGKGMGFIPRSSGIWNLGFGIFSTGP